MEWMPIAMMPAVGPGPAAATKMTARTISGNVRTATSKALPGSAQRVPPSRLPAARNDSGKASKAPSAVPRMAMKNVTTIEFHASLKTAVSGRTRPRRSGSALRCSPVATRAQVGRLMVAMARTNRATRRRTPPMSSVRFRRTCAGAGGTTVGTGRVVSMAR